MQFLKDDILRFTHYCIDRFEDNKRKWHHESNGVVCWNSADPLRTVREIQPKLKNKLDAFIKIFREARKITIDLSFIGNE